MSKVITQDNEQVIQIYNRLKDTLTRLEDIPVSYTHLTLPTT